MRSRSCKRRRCIHGYNVGKQALRQEFMQKTVELRASANADTATQRYVKTCEKNAKRLQWYKCVWSAASQQIRLKSENGGRQFKVAHLLLFHF